MDDPIAAWQAQGRHGRTPLQRHSLAAAASKLGLQAQHGAARALAKPPALLGVVPHRGRRATPAQAQPVMDTTCVCYFGRDMSCAFCNTRDEVEARVVPVRPAAQKEGH